MEGKRALAIGAGSIGPGWGNGKAVAVAFAREGEKVMCADINLVAAEETVHIISSEGGTAHAVAMSGSLRSVASSMPASDSLNLRKVTAVRAFQRATIGKSRMIR